MRKLRAHVDSLLAVVLAAAWLLEWAASAASQVGEPLVEGFRAQDAWIAAAGVVFLLSLALRTRLPLVSLGLAYPVLLLAGQVPLDASWALLVGVLLAVYSSAAWAGGRAAQVGALGVGALGGLLVLRAAGDGLEPREVAVPVVLVVGAWALGLAVRSVRMDRGDERVRGAPDWELAAATPESAVRDETVRELRDVIERAMSAVVLQARSARRSLDREPLEARRALTIIEEAGTEALEETQRLTGLLLSPHGARLPELRPGLADLDDLATEVTEAGLPVAIRVEGRPLPLTADLDAAAYRVIQEALTSTLQHTVDGRADVVVRYLDDELQVQVDDDGTPLEGADATEETAGLLAARDEVASLGGTLDAGPRKGRGYWVMARLPYEPDWS
jgi:signal transduction histidine kinase